MMKNVELNDAVHGLQAQTEVLQTQQSEVLRALADHSNTMKAIQKQSDGNLLAFGTVIQQFQIYQLHNDSKLDSFRQQLLHPRPSPINPSGTSSSSGILPIPQTNPYHFHNQVQLILPHF